MLIKLHSQATTTPKIRAAIQASDEPAWVLAERHGTTEQTVWKWRNRDSVEDRSHTPHRLQTTLTPAQEAVAVALRQTLLVSLDERTSVLGRNQFHLVAKRFHIASQIMCAATGFKNDQARFLLSDEHGKLSARQLLAELNLPRV